MSELTEDHDEIWYAVHGQENGRMVTLSDGSNNFRMFIKLPGVNCLSCYLNNSKEDGGKEVYDKVIPGTVTIDEDKCKIDMKSINLEVQEK